MYIWCICDIYESDKTLLPENSKQLLFSLNPICQVSYYFLKGKERKIRSETMTPSQNNQQI